MVVKKKIVKKSTTGLVKPKLAKKTKIVEKEKIGDSIVSNKKEIVKETPKKKIKKIKKVEKKVQKEPSTELPMASMNDKEEENYKPVDMSSIPAPVITFQMPNLRTPSDDEEEKKPKTKTIKKKSQVKKAEVLTALALSDEIVHMRKVVNPARKKLIQILVRQKKMVEKSAKKNEKSQKKFAKLGEQIAIAKKMELDKVTKFALLNTKTFEELNAVGTKLEDVVLYRWACEKKVVEKVAQLRAKYVDFNATASFLLQRLGLQYQGNKKTDEDKNEVNETDDEMEDEDNDESDEDNCNDQAEEKDVTEAKVEKDESPQVSDEEEDVGDEEDYATSDVEIAVSDEEEEQKMVQKRRDALLGLIGAKFDSKRTGFNPKKRKIEDDDELVQKTNAKAPRKEEVKKEKVVKKIVKKEKPKKGNEEQEPIAMIKKIKLSEGGIIEKTAPLKPNISENCVKKDVEDDDDDEEETSFFIKKADNGNVKKKDVEEKKKPTNKGISKKMGKNEGKVHPSWQAKMQKKKELESLKPCGKKIKFDDDDD